MKHLRQRKLATSLLRCLELQRSRRSTQPIPIGITRLQELVNSSSWWSIDWWWLVQELVTADPWMGECAWSLEQAEASAEALRCSWGRLEPLCTLQASQLFETYSTCAFDVTVRPSTSIKKEEIISIHWQHVSPWNCKVTHCWCQLSQSIDNW
jgi:hypothetical protein